MAKSYYYYCRNCGEDFSSKQEEHCCAECLSGDIQGGEVTND